MEAHAEQGQVLASGTVAGVVVRVGPTARKPVTPSSPGRARIPRRPGMAQMPTAPASRVSRTTMTYLIDDLERAGLAQRRSDPQDRRNRQVVATDHGRRLLRELNRCIRQVEDDVFAGLTDQEQETLAGLLRKAAAHGSTTNAADAPCGWWRCRSRPWPRSRSWAGSGARKGPRGALSRGLRPAHARREGRWRWRVASRCRQSRSRAGRARGQRESARRLVHGAGRGEQAGQVVPCMAGWVGARPGLPGDPVGRWLPGDGLGDAVPARLASACWRRKARSRKMTLSSGGAVWLLTTQHRLQEAGKRVSMSSRRIAADRVLTAGGYPVGPPAAGIRADSHGSSRSRF